MGLHKGGAIALAGPVRSPRPWFLKRVEPFLVEGAVQGIDSERSTRSKHFELKLQNMAILVENGEVEPPPLIRPVRIW